jgi:YggT family protein
MVLIVAIQGVLYLWDGPSSRRFDFLIGGWVFAVDSPLWAPAKSVVVYLVLLFRLLAFASLVLALKRPEDSYDQVSRLFREALGPADRLPAKYRFALPGLLLVIFSLALALAWKLCVLLGLLPSEPNLVIRSLLVAAALLVGLISIFAFLIFVRAVLSWLPLGGASRAGARLGWLENVTDPFIAPFHRLNLRAGGWDFTPLAAIFALMIVRRVLLIGLSALQRGAAGS